MQKRNTIDNPMIEKNMVETISQSKGEFQNDDLNMQKKNILTNICHDENISHLKIDKKKYNRETYINKRQQMTEAEKDGAKKTKTILC